MTEERKTINTNDNARVRTNEIQGGREYRYESLSAARNGHRTLYEIALKSSQLCFTVWYIGKEIILIITLETQFFYHKNYRFEIRLRKKKI